MLWASGPWDASPSRVLYRPCRLLVLVVAWTECICSSWQSHWQSGGQALTFLNLMDYRRLSCCLFVKTVCSTVHVNWALAEAEKPKDACGLVEVLQIDTNRCNTSKSDTIASAGNCSKMFQNMLIWCWYGILMHFWYFWAFLVPSLSQVLSTFVKEQAILPKAPDGATLQSEAALQSPAFCV